MWGESNMGYERKYSTINSMNKTLSKDRQHRKLTGVCAGIAKHYDCPRTVIRIAAVAVSIMLPVVTGAAYVVASILLPNSTQEK